MASGGMARRRRHRNGMNWGGGGGGRVGTEGALQRGGRRGAAGE